MFLLIRFSGIQKKAPVNHIGGNYKCDEYDKQTNRHNLKIPSEGKLTLIKLHTGYYG